MINYSIVSSPHTISSEWIVITNARVIHNNGMLPDRGSYIYDKIEIKK